MIPLFPQQLMPQQPTMPHVVMPPRLPIPPLDLTAAQAPSFGAMMPPAVPMSGTPIVPGAGGPPPVGPAIPGFNLDAQNLALLTAAAGLLQGPRPGQTSLGAVGESLLGGAKTYMGVKGAERQESREERKVRAVEEGVELDKRRQTEAEKTGALSRQEIEQKIAQNAKTFPKLIEKLDGEIAGMVAEGKLKEEQAAFWKERARLYPTEVNADLIKARAAATAAGKPSGTEAMFESTAAAMAKTEGIPVEEARARLGGQYFGRAGRTAAGVQNLEAVKKEWKLANPKSADETPEAYEQRAAQAALDLHTQRKSQGYFQSKLEYLKYSLDREADSAAFDRMWVGAGNELPQVKPGRADPSQGEDLPKGQDGKIDPKMLVDGKTYRIRTQNYTGPAKWDAKQQRLIPVGASPSTK